MTLRTAHGRGSAALVRIETVPVDELPDGVQVVEEAEAGWERRADGTFARGARTQQRRGGLALAQRTTLSSKLGLTALVADSAFAPYQRAARSFIRSQTRVLARNIGGGQLGPASASMVASAGLQLAASRWLFDQGGVDGDPVLLVQAARLADQSRQSLLTAHELAAREAAARARRERLAAEAAERDARRRRWAAICAHGGDGTEATAGVPRPVRTSHDSDFAERGEDDD